MDGDEFTRRLRALRQELSEADYFSLVLSRLSKDPSDSERQALENSLGAYSHVDPERVAKYWEPGLSSDDAFQREMAARELALLVHSFSSPLAYQLLTEFLGQRPDPGKLDDILRDRMLRLFPGYRGKQ